MTTLSPQQIADLEIADIVKLLLRVDGDRDPTAGSNLKVEHVILIAEELRMIKERISEARRRLAKGRALWNGPCHECDAVLAALEKESNP